MTKRDPAASNGLGLSWRFLAPILTGLAAKLLVDLWLTRAGDTVGRNIVLHHGAAAILFLVSALVLWRLTRTVATTGRTGSLPYSLRPVAVGLLAVVFFPDVLQIFGVHGLSRSVGGFLQLLASFACAWAVIALLEPFNTRDVVRNVAQHGEAAP